MTSPLAQKTPALSSFVRFVVLGGGVGVLSSFAVSLLATAVPWVIANAVVTVVSTLLCTELHARFTFRKGRGAVWREHWQSAGSALAAYLATGAAVFALHLVQSAPGMVAEQGVYLGASALAGVARFLVLRLHVFAAGRRRARADSTRKRSSCQPMRAQRSSVVPRTKVTVLYPVELTSSVNAPSTMYSPRGRFPAPTPTSTGPRTVHNWPPSARSSTSAEPLASAS
ncbi:GtrA family protein [Streptomyces roseirectus]|uniref:GtrA family protein n=1 Tax=Streptomyces roseirectus TaxID=2768066 RepID=UPI001FE24A84